jgi:hypothetical protein
MQAEFLWGNLSDKSIRKTAEMGDKSIDLKKIIVRNLAQDCVQWLALLIEMLTLRVLLPG